MILSQVKLLLQVGKLVIKKKDDWGLWAFDKLFNVLENVSITSTFSAKEFPCEGDSYDYPAIQSVAKVTAVDE
jgi:hypothetical protein